MRKFLALIGMLVCLTSSAWADPSIVDDPKGATEKAVEVVKVLTPSADVIYNKDGDWYPGTSVDLLNLGKLHKSLNLFQARAGWAETQVMYSTLSLDLAKLTSFKYAKYVHAGLAVGYSWQDEDLVFGPVIGIKVEF